MIWLIIGIIALTSSGHTVFFLTPKLKKHVNTYVLDKERKKEIFSIMDVSKKQQKAFVKKRNTFLKASKQLNFDRSTTREQYKILNEEYHQVRNEMQIFSVESEMKIKAIILEDEWEKIMEDILANVSKSKIRSKMESGSNKYFKKLIYACNTHILREQDRKNAIESIEGYRVMLNISIPRLSEVSYLSLENIRDYNTSVEVYNKVGKEISQIRKELMDSYLDTRFKLVEYTTDEEWKKIISEINQLNNKGPEVN